LKEHKLQDQIVERIGNEAIQLEGIDNMNMKVLGSAYTFLERNPGQELTPSQFENIDDLIEGGPGNDTLNGDWYQILGSEGNDTLDGGPGNDSLQGGQGNDTYLFGRGYGIDTISTGCTIALACEMFERGIISPKDTGGLKIHYGDVDTIHRLIEMIGRREGFGDILADGVKVAAQKIGRGAELYAVHIGGQELAMHDPRFMETMGPTFCGDPAPGRHTSSSGLAPLTPVFRLTDLTGLCLMHFVSTSMGLPYDKLLSVATGWEFTSDEANLAGERVNVMRQVFALREGLKPSDWD
jgi:hypothetical protein